MTASFSSNQPNQIKILKSTTMKNPLASTNRKFFCRLCSFIFAAAVYIALPSISEAQIITLSGFEVYPTDAAGATDNSGYLFNDNSSSSTIWTNMTLTDGAVVQSSGIALNLSLGANDISFSNAPGYPASNTSFAGISLFFTSDGSSYNPAGSTSGGSAPNLSAFSAYPGSGVLTPLAGTLVPDYASPNNSIQFTEVLDPYSGASNYVLNNYSVSVTGLTFSGSGGTLELTVVPLSAPEPNTMSLILVSCFLFAVIGYRRKLSWS